MVVMMMIVMVEDRAKNINHVDDVDVYRMSYMPYLYINHSHNTIHLRYLSKIIEGIKR